MNPLRRAATVLTSIAVACAAIASVTTLVWSGAFPDPSPALAFNGVLAEARGWSAVTLCMALPIAIVSLVAARRGSLRGRLAWLGALAYLVYTYLEFAVSPPFTPLYLVYIVAFACAIPALVMGVASIDVDALPAGFALDVPRRPIAVFALAFSVLLSVAWLMGIAERTVRGDFGWPDALGSVGHVVHALDLGLQVPLGIATGLLLLSHRPAGYVLAAILLVDAVLMGAALTAMVSWSAIVAGRSALEGAPFAVVSVIAAALIGAFFRAVTNGGPATRRA